MPKVKRQALQSWTNTGLTAFFESFESDRVTDITTSGRITDVYFTHNMGLRFSLRDNPPSDWMTVSPIVNGSVLGYIVQPCAVRTSNGVITGSIGDNIVYFALSDGKPRRMMFFYSELDNDIYYTYAGSGDNSASFYNLSGSTLTRLSGGNTFNYGTLFGYNRATGTIDYLDRSYLFAGTTRTEIADSDIISSSTVTTDTMYTFDGTNYYAVGSNLLIPIED